jgi:hypothetical protein
MKFQPSEHSFGAFQQFSRVPYYPTAPYYGDYGWASAFPLTALTVSSTATARGLSNMPATSQHESNLSRLSDFLAKIPFPIQINSGYRSPTVNAAVGGSSSSQHMNGLAADIRPLTMSNKELAQWFYEYRKDFPELDQVIWYHDTSHVHVGICPSGGKGCPRSYARGEFLSARKEGSVYTPWAPTATEQAKMAAIFAKNRPVQTGLAVIGLYVAASAAVAGVTLALLWRYTRNK